MKPDRGRGGRPCEPILRRGMVPPPGNRPSPRCIDPRVLFLDEPDGSGWNPIARGTRAVWETSWFDLRAQTYGHPTAVSSPTHLPGGGRRAIAIAIADPCTLGQAGCAWATCKETLRPFAWRRKATRSIRFLRHYGRASAPRFPVALSRGRIRRTAGYGQRPRASPKPMDCPFQSSLFTGLYREKTFVIHRVFRVCGKSWRPTISTETFIHPAALQAPPLWLAQSSGGKFFLHARRGDHCTTQ